MKRLLMVLLIAALTFTGIAVAAQEDGTTLLSPMDLMSRPASANMEGFRYEAQGWNNCGPATLTMGLSYFGYQDNQLPAANWLKPNTEDKNVSPWQMVQFVNEEAPGTTRALMRYGGDLDLLKTLIANEFPVIIEAGYDPPPHDLGWMGHYLLMKGYDDNITTFITHDSYDGANHPYAYAEIEDKWYHFNNVYIVLYDITREAELMELLGTDADPVTNLQNTMESLTADFQADPTNPFTLFNIGSIAVEMGNYEVAVGFYDEARRIGLPWRMLWYQFGPFEAYYSVGRYGDVIQLAQANLNDGGGQYVEETYFYAGLAREALGETQRAVQNYNTAIQFNP
ncbi:MAG: C39 family peptidase, partial [Chloroflexota bacterium]